MKLTDYKPKAVQRILVYGPPKSGKTSLVGKLAESGYKLLYFDLENGAVALLYNVGQQFHSNIELIQLPDTQLYPIAIETILKVINGTPVKICQEHGKVNCPLCLKNPEATPSIGVELNKLADDTIVVIDSVTQLSNSAMNFICKDQYAKGNDNYKPDWDDWRKQGLLLDRIFSTIQQADYNVIAISHETLVEMEDGKKKIVPVGGTSNFSKTFAKYFDHVVYCEVLNMRHKFASKTTYSTSVLSGSRTNAELEKMETPSLLTIFRPDAIQPGAAKK